MTEAVVENNSGSDTQTTQEGAKDSIGKEVGKLLAREKGASSKKHLQYPLKRSGKEDSLLIRCVKYKTPQAKGPIVSKGVTEATDEDTKYLGKNPVELGGKTYNKGDTIPAGTEIFKKNKFAWNDQAYNTAAEGMDRRYNQHQSGYNGNTYNTDTQFYVELPIPRQISDGNAVDWGENSMNMFQMAGFGLAQGALGDKEKMQETQAVINALQQGSGLEQMGIEGTSEITQAMRSALGGMAVNVFGGNITPNQFLSRASGKILNSNKELLFAGVKLREFTFDFTFTPRSAKEGERAKQIIRKFKQHMSPRAGEEIQKGSEGFFVNSPDLFLLRYLSAGKDHPFLNSFKPCALTAFSVNYSAGGAYASYGTGGDSTPVHMGVKMTFKETNPVYFEDYNENVPGVGF
tara:strand:+ start:12 stop:1223 length:1212 start_codon:yes stop_codon:yes gene_type:complete